MDTTGSLLHDLTRRIGALGAPALLIFAIALALATFVVAVLVADVLAGSAEPVLMAPFRW